MGLNNGEKIKITVFYSWTLRPVQCGWIGGLMDGVVYYFFLDITNSTLILSLQLSFLFSSDVCSHEQSRDDLYGLTGIITFRLPQNQQKDKTSRVDYELIMIIKSMIKLASEILKAVRIQFIYIKVP